MNSLQRGSLKLCYEDSGNTATPIVFVHGWCCDHSYFAPQFRHFAPRHRVVSIDQRGHGESDKPKQDYTIEGFADDLAWLCGELRLSRPALVGHSMGGAIVLATAARHPGLARAIVLCDPAVIVAEPVLAAIRPFIDGLQGPEYRTLAQGFIAERLFSKHDDAQRKARIVAAMSATPQHVMHSCFHHLFSFDSEAAALACKIPALLIDAEAPIPDRARFKKLCPQLETAQTAGAGHFHQLEVPEQVSAMIERFLAHVP
jgi:pimeloyl-ACP methyl ester carboxylesterase